MSRPTILSLRDRNRVSLLLALGGATLAALLVRLALYDYHEQSAFMHGHGYCYLWVPSLVAAHMLSDLAIGVSYVAISVTLVYLVWRTRQGLPFTWVFVAFGAFIVACGATHFMEVWTLWSPVFWLSADVKIITAIASVATAIALPPLVPKILTLVEDARLSDQRRIELEQIRAELERRVRERTADLAAALKRAEEANRAKESFLATVSHELRTPLNAILGWADVLQRRPDPQLVPRAIPVIKRNALAQARMVGDLLDISSITAGKMRLEMRATDFGNVVEAAVDVVRPAADAKRVALEVSGTEPGVIVHGDAERLQQVVWNLVSNAVKFTPEQGRVTVRLDRTGSNQARLTVSDTGAGIAAEFLPAVFDRFTQADASPTRVHQGLGLGLAIVRHLVELHGGIVRAVSEGPGRGSTFIVELPLYSAAAARKAADEGRPGSASLHGRRVLVIDDDTDSRDAIAAMLEMAGAETAAAESAEAGLAQLRSSRFDALVSDIAMPEKDGLTLIREIRAQAEAEVREIPAVALSAYAREEDRARALAAGFHRHVAKPVTADGLVRCVTAAIEDAA